MSQKPGMSLLQHLVMGKMTNECRESLIEMRRLLSCVYPAKHKGNTLTIRLWWTNSSPKWINRCSTNIKTKNPVMCFVPCTTSAEILVGKAKAPGSECKVACNAKF